MHASGLDEDVRRAVADGLWTGIRHEPPLPSMAVGWRGWYLDRIFRPIAQRRRERVWSHRNPEPWLTLQSALTRGGRAANARETLRFEGLPGGHSYEDAYLDVVNGRFDVPYIFVAGAMRTGTTSIQNLIMRAFPNHVQPGKWGDPGHPLRLWWYPKHKVVTAQLLATIDPRVCRVLVTIREALPTLASQAVYEGCQRPEDVTREWLDSHVTAWIDMALVAFLPGGLAVDFHDLRHHTPRQTSDKLALSLGLRAAEGQYRQESWRQLSEGGISPDVIDDARYSNLPHEHRAGLALQLSHRIGEMLGGQLDELDDLHRRALATNLVGPTDHDILVGGVTVIHRDEEVEDSAGIDSEAVG